MPTSGIHMYSWMRTHTCTHTPPHKHVEILWEDGHRRLQTLYHFAKGA